MFHLGPSRSAWTSRRTRVGRSGYRWTKGEILDLSDPQLYITIIAKKVLIQKCLKQQLPCCNVNCGLMLYAFHYSMIVIGIMCGIDYVTVEYVQHYSSVWGRETLS